MDISVIIPIKNRAHLIIETLDSILNQTLLPKEIIIVDDCSTDDLKQVLLPYFDKIILVKSEGHGPGAARNTGLKIATGKAIQFFDSDDVMTPNKLEVQAALLNDNSKAGCVIGPFVSAKKINGNWVQTDVIMQYQPLLPKPLYDIVAEGWCSITQACLFSRTLIDQVGDWREDIMTHEDKEYWFRIALLNPFPIHENKSLTIYRQHEQQVTDKTTQEVERTQNGILVFSDMLNRENGKLSIFSKWVLKGILANYKMYSVKYKLYYPIKRSDYVVRFVAKIYSKLGRLQTGTDWQPIHSVTKDEQVFTSFLRLFNKR